MLSQSVEQNTSRSSREENSRLTFEPQTTKQKCKRRYAILLNKLSIWLESRRFTKLRYLQQEIKKEFETQSSQIPSLIYLVSSKLSDYALKQLQSESFKIALNIFKVEEKILKDYSKFYNIEQQLHQKQVQLFNNIGCCYRQLGDLENAKIYLQKAIKISYDNRGLSYLNLCAVISHLGDHKKALKQAEKALEEITWELNKMGLQPSEREPPLNRGKYQEKVKLLAIAHYNCGTEKRFMQQTKQAVISFKKSYEIASDYLGINHPLTKRSRATYKNLNKLASGGKKIRSLNLRKTPVSTPSVSQNKRKIRRRKSPSKSNRSKSPKRRKIKRKMIKSPDIIKFSMKRPRSAIKCKFFLQTINEVQNF